MSRKAFWYLGTFRADSKVLTLVISIALDEARLWLHRSKNLDRRATRCPRRGTTENLLELLSKWREEPSLVVEQREIRRILQEAALDLPLIY
jgi:hypothetical protein